MSVAGKATNIQQLAIPGAMTRTLMGRAMKVTSRIGYHEHPLAVASASGTEIIDVDGNRYLDFTSGLTANAVGHHHPLVVATMQEQVIHHILTYDTFYSEPWIALHEALATLAPFDEIARVFLCNSTPLAKEMAMYIASRHTGRRQFLGFVNNLQLAAEPTAITIPAQQRTLAPLHRITPVPFPDPSRPLFAQQGGETDPGRQVVDYIESVILRFQANADDIAGIFVEPIHLESGNVVPPATFLPALRDLCNRYGILLIADESHSGTGRTGRWWAIEYDNVKPDIVCIGRGTAGGMPIGGLLLRQSIDLVQQSNYEPFFGGSALISAAALATLDVIRNEGLQNAEQEGYYLKETLNLIAAHHSTIGQIRGRGLLVGVELVWDRVNRVPATTLRNRVNQRCFEHGLLLAGCGQSTIQFIPPLTVTRDEIDEALAIFEYALTLAEAELLRA